MTFTEQKQWVHDNLNKDTPPFGVPGTYYPTPYQNALSFISLIEARIAHCNENNLPINKDKVAMSTKNNLQRLIDDIKKLQESENISK